MFVFWPGDPLDTAPEAVLEGELEELLVMLAALVVELLVTELADVLEITVLVLLGMPRLGGIDSEPPSGEKVKQIKKILGPQAHRCCIH